MHAKAWMLLSVVIAVYLTPGCVGAGGPDASGAAVTGASNGPYAAEFREGYAHHSNASGLFNDAVTLWDEDDYADAASLLEQSRDEYALAGDHYHAMAGYASNAGELGFARAMEDSTIDMGDATTRYLMSIDQAMADNDTASLEYFQEGQELVDRSMLTINQSFDLMPPCLE